MSAPTTSMPMQTPLDLIVHELSELLSAEKIIATMLETAVNAATRPDIRQVLANHVKETASHAANLERIFRDLGAVPHAVASRTAGGLMVELQEALATKPSDLVTDALILGGVSKTEYFEVASYNALVQQTRANGMTEIAAILQQNLEQENAARQAVDTIIDEQAIELAGVLNGATTPAETSPAVSS
jgi:ferritin-like metal-binding protein YciE